MDKIYRYFSQYGEDFLLWEFFDYKPQGFFIDIGAFDGIHLSNSYSFELTGWTGICVEPHPLYFKLCQKNRPASKCFNVACVIDDNNGKLSFNTDNTGLFSSIKNIGNDENIIGHFGTLKNKSIQIETIEVNSISLNLLLSNAISNDTKIDFISIDVEGVEQEVLQGFDLVKYKPLVICIETNSNKAQRQITSYLEQFGYIWARKTDANSFFVTNNEDYKKINNIKLNCMIEKQMHPLGEDYTSPSYKTGLVFHEGVDIFKKCRSFQEKIKKFDDLLKKQREYIDKQNIQINKLSTQLKKNEACLHIAEKNNQNILNSHSYKIGKKITLPFALMKRFIETASNKK